MKCENCGAEFNTGSFCPNCGAKCNEEASGIKSDIKVIYDKRGTEAEKDKEQTKKAEKMPWCFSIWFIIIISILTFWIFWIPGVILAIIRFLKYKEKRGNSAVLALLLGIPCGVLVFALVSELVSDSKADKQLNAYIENGQYAEAQELIDQEYAVGTLSYVEKSARLYELQGMYDEAVNLWVEYCNAEYKPIDIPDYRIDKLNGYVEKYGSELQSETVDKIQTLINNKELARAKEKAEKEAKEAKEKAEKEAKEAEEKAKKEAKKAEEKAAKEAKEAEEKAAKEAKEAEEKAAKEAKEAEEKAAKEEKKAEEENAKETTKSNSQYKKVGDELHLITNDKEAGDEDDLIATITGIGIYGNRVVYVDVDLQNVSDERIAIANNNLYVYVDGYQVTEGKSAEVFEIEAEFREFASGETYFTNINPNKKMKYTFFQVIDSIDGNSDIEVELFGYPIELIIAN